MFKLLRKQLRGVFGRLGSLLPWGRTRSAMGRVVRPWRDDALRSSPSDGITPERLVAILHTADNGDPERQFELYADMLEKWPRLAAVEATRRIALTGLEWEIAPSLPMGGGVQLAKRGARGARLAAAAADHCRDALLALEPFRDVLDRLASAIGYGIAVAELVWERGRLVDIVPVPHTRLVADTLEPWRLRVRTEAEPTVGVAIDEQPGKWIVHRPESRTGCLFDAGLLRASARLFTAQNLSFKDWLTFSEIGGMPVRVGRHDPGMAEPERQELLSTLRGMANDAVAVVSKAVEIELLDAARTGERPYEPMQRFCSTEVTILWLGQHLTTDIGDSGSRAAAEVQDRVREDLLVNDIAAEGRTLRRDLLTPLVWARFGANTPVPQFRRSLVQSIDTQKLAATLATAVNELRMPVPRAWAHQALGIPAPQGDEAVIGAE